MIYFLYHDPLCQLKKDDTGLLQCDAKQNDFFIFMSSGFPYLQLSGRPIINSYDDEQDASISYQAYQTSWSFTFSLEETPVA